MPTRGKRAGLCLAISDHAAHKEVRVVERSAVGVGEAVAELTTLIDRPGRLRGRMTRDAAGKRELPEEPAKSRFVSADVGVELAVGAFEVGIGHDSGTAVTGPRDEDGVEIESSDHPVQMRIDKVQPGRGAPVAKQPRLYVLGPQRLVEQRVVQ